ncbi:AraC family transcriptional regulator [Endozoicomonas arenosclerae]|uniref:AraC family transcriptional regulator n=1 Tax=Endozoicomonas arenosclerae TaxID=1633495 RepID=UPI000784E48C|nr:AraC family transcriptional regulator [Endozoicomonas arenosclerae]
MQRQMPSRFARSLLKLLREEAHRSLALELSGIASEQLETENIALDDYCRLFHEVVYQIQAELHGDEADKVRRFSSYQLLLESMTQAETLKDALDKADCFFQRMSFSKAAISLEVEGASALWVFEFPQSTSERFDASHFSMDGFGWLPGLMGCSTALWIWWNIAGWLIGEPISLEEVRFDAPWPERISQYEALFDATVTCNSPVSALRFDSSFLDRPVIKNQRDVQQLMLNFLQGLFDVRYKDRSLSVKIEEHLGSHEGEMPTLKSLAGSFNMSVPTLHRHLQKENTSYQALKNQYRRKRAEEMLMTRRLSICEIAVQSGFSDAAAFHRAFKKWTGITPNQYRQSLA